MRARGVCERRAFGNQGEKTKGWEKKEEGFEEEGCDVKNLRRRVAICCVGSDVKNTLCL